VGFEPTVRITAQRLSSLKILMLVCVVQYLSVCSSLAFLLRPSYPVMLDTVPCCVARLQIRLQTLVTAMSTFPAIANFHEAPSHVRF
jgi:hypothetical protein